MAHVQDRPLSPHLQIWRWHVTMLASIAHRASGIAMYVGCSGSRNGWFWRRSRRVVRALRFDPARADRAGRDLSDRRRVGYHLCNGLRHLFWDTGKGFNPKICEYDSVAALVVGALGAPLALYVLLTAVRP